MLRFGSYLVPVRLLLLVAALLAAIGFALIHFALGGSGGNGRLVAPPPISAKQPGQLIIGTVVSGRCDTQVACQKKAVPGAQVLVNPSVGQQVSTTNQNGMVLLRLPMGHYRLEARLGTRKTTKAVTVSPRSSVHFKRLVIVLK